ncbi:MAG: cell division protein ZapE [Alphaproteobacteria bacterium]
MTAAADRVRGPLALLRAMRRSGALKPDPRQELAAEKLQSLHHALHQYRPDLGKADWRARLGFARRKTDPPQGLYLFGDVGRGKSMLMDMFFDTAPVPRKRRVHFNAFMIEVHDRIHEWRERHGGDDPIPPLAERIAREAWLLCFDEMQVGDVADAMILRRLFTALFEAGIVVVATSNQPPDELYKDGLQRERFLPFIDLLKERLDLLALDGDEDYRLARLRGMAVYHMPLGPESDAALDAAFLGLTDRETGDPDEIVVQARALVVPEAAKGVARFTFADLCERPLGAADYLAIAARYHTLILAGIRRMTPERRNEAKRFVILIDSLYEHGVNLVCAAEGPPRDLYPAGDGGFEFARTVSRLMEMQARDYLARPHLA